MWKVDYWPVGRAWMNMDAHAAGLRSASAMHRGALPQTWNRSKSPTPSRHVLHDVVDALGGQRGALAVVDALLVQLHKLGQRGLQAARRDDCAARCATVQGD